MVARKRVLMFDYRGYGDSAGKPSREGIYQDCLAALAYVSGRPDVAPDRVVTFGQRIAPVPILIVHGTDDSVVPYHHGRMLFEAAGEPKKLVTVPGGLHIGAFARPEPAYRDKLVRFYRKALNESR
jgi:fermentation-respiration switch protein FrsA (DUF1100 family)